MIVTTSTKTGFELLNQAISILFTFKITCWLDGVHIIFLINNFPSTHWLQGCSFHSRWIPIIIGKLTISGFTPVGIIFLTFWCLVLEEKMINLIHYRLFRCTTVSTTIFKNSDKLCDWDIHNFSYRWTMLFNMHII